MSPPLCTSLSTASQMQLGGGRRCSKSGTGVGRGQGCRRHRGLVLGGTARSGAADLDHAHLDSTFPGAEATQSGVVATPRGAPDGAPADAAVDDGGAAARAGSGELGRRCRCGHADLRGWGRYGRRARVSHNRKGPDAVNARGVCGLDLGRGSRGTRFDGPADWRLEVNGAPRRTLMLSAALRTAA